MNTLLETLAKIGVDRGISFVISIVFLACLIIGLGVFYKNWTSQKAWERKRAEEKDKQDIENTKELRELNKQFAYTIANSTLRIDGFDKVLEKHTTESNNSLKNIDDKLDELDNKVKVIGNTQDTLATKEMVREVSDGIQEIRQELKKD